MKIPIEKWIDEKHFSVNVKDLFRESIICHKNQAYRASLIFSYMAFLTTLRELILKSPPPKRISETSPSRWKSITDLVEDDETWEKTVFTELINSKNPIFNINESIREQIKYWKDRRNDAAHFKTNEINEFTVESFWSFIKSNLQKISLEGGKESLIKSFKKHFNISFTSPGKDFTSLVKEIEFSVEKKDLKSFFIELRNELDDWGYEESDSIKVFNRILEISPPFIKEELIAYLKVKNLDIKHITVHLDKISFLNYSDHEVRELWINRIYDRGQSRNAFFITSALIRNNLIPEDEIKESLEYAFEKFNQTSSSHFYCDENCHLVLSANGFGDIIYQKSIIEKELSDFLWVNSKTDIIAYYFENYTLKSNTVKALCEMAVKKKHSWWLIREINSVFEKNNLKKAEFKKIATRKGYTIPTVLIV